MTPPQLAATLACVCILLALETGAETALKVSSDNKSLLPLLGGVALYAAVGLVFGLALRWGGGKLTIVNALWQTANLCVVTLVGVIAFKETLNPVQWIGIVLAILASVCFLI